MELSEYLKRFKTVMGVLTGTLGALPLISGLLPGKAGDFAFPPLGTFQTFWELLSAVIAGVAILLVFFVRESSSVRNPDKRTRAFLFLAGTVFLCVIAYFVEVQSSVKEVVVSSNSKTVSVSVGFQRTAAAQKEYSGKNDWQMLEIAGWDEPQIQNLWTRRSIIISRSMLFGAYLCLLNSLIVLGSFAVLCDAHDHPKPQSTNEESQS